MRIAPTPAPEMKNIPPNNIPRTKSAAPTTLQPFLKVRIPLTHAAVLRQNAAVMTNSKLPIANTAGKISRWLAQSPDVSQSPCFETTVHAEKAIETIKQNIIKESSKTEKTKSLEKTSD